MFINLRPDSDYSPIINVGQITYIEVYGDLQDDRPYRLYLQGNSPTFTLTKEEHALLMTYIKKYNSLWDLLSP